MLPVDRESRPAATRMDAGGEADNDTRGGTRMTSGSGKIAPREKKGLSPIRGPLRRLRRLRGRGGSVGSVRDLQGLTEVVSSTRELPAARDDEINMDAPPVMRSIRPSPPSNDADSRRDDDEGSITGMSVGGCSVAGSSGGKDSRGPGRMVRKLSASMSSRFKGKSHGGSETMTLGRASLMRDGSAGEGLVSPPNFDDGRDDGHLRSSSAVRKLPAEWTSSTAVLTPSETSSAGPSPPPRSHHQRQYHTVGDPTIIRRGVSAPGVARSHLHHSGSPIGGGLKQLQSQPQPLSLEETIREMTAASLGQEEAPPATTMPVAPAVPAAAETETENAPAVGRSRRLSGGSGRLGRRSSASPTRRYVVGLAAAVAAGVRRGPERERSTSPQRDAERNQTLKGNASAAAGSWKTLTADLLETSAEEKPVRRLSVHSCHGHTGVGDCVVEPAPPSTLKYGDRLRLWARPPPPESGVVVTFEDDSLAGSSAGGTGGGGGYVGSLDKVLRVQQKLFRRSESAVINRSGGTVTGFIDCHFKVVDPDGKHAQGDDVCLGETVLLVDDRGFVWNYNTNGNASTVRMKPQSSAKHKAPVCFRLPNEDTPQEGNNLVKFGPHGLEIVPVDQGSSSNKDSRRRRVGSRKDHALTTHWKKTAGSSRGSVAVLVGDGRGDQVVFEVHLPNASPAGDPSPVVTKVIIHANEIQTIAAPPAEEDDEEALSSEASPLTTPIPGSREHGPRHSRPRSGSVTSNGRRRGGSLGDAETLILVSSSKLGQQKEGGGMGSSGKAREAETASDSPCGSSVFSSTAPEIPWRAHAKTWDGREGEDMEGESVMEETADVGTFEGLKWGDFVQFKLPGEDEVSPDDLMLTLMLSNGCSASLTSKHIRDNAGRERFPLAASRLKSVINRDASLDAELDEGGEGGGTVYLRCTLTPLVCFEMDEAAAGGYWDSSGAPGGVMGGDNPSKSPAQEEAVAKWRVAGKRWTQKSATIVFFLATATVIHLSAPTTAPNFLGNIWTSSSFNEKSAPSPSPRVCTSVWDLRRSDGTAYPHQQLSAAAAAFETAAPGLRAAAASVSAERGKKLPTAAASTDKEACGGAAPADDEISITSAYGGFLPRGEGGWARLCSIAIAIVAAGVLVIDRFFGSGGAGKVLTPATPAPPMQARVHLLEWDKRCISETRATAEALVEEGTYHTAPSGSGLTSMPHRFALAESMNMAKAWARWENTISWRKENAVDIRLSRPHSKFSLIKSLYPHCFHLPDKGGRVTYYERPGLSDFAELKKAGISKQDLVEHYVYCMEYLWQVLQPRQSQKVTVIIDLDGVRFRDMAGESVGFLKTTVGIMSRHYPQRSFKILILNAPSFFNSVFSMVKPMLNESTKKKIEMLPVATADRGLLEVIPSENLPSHYGGTSQVPLMESPAEAALLNHVKKVLELNQQTMESTRP